jgi:hypothetical protein
MCFGVRRRTYVAVRSSKLAPLPTLRRQWPPFSEEGFRTVRISIFQGQCSHTAVQPTFTRMCCCSFLFGNLFWQHPEHELISL